MIRKKYSKKETLIGIAAAVLVILILTFFVWHQMESVRLGYEIGKLEEKVSSLKEQVKKLETKKSALLSLERVEKIAREKLRLAPATESQVIYDESDFVP